MGRDAGVFKDRDGRWEVMLAFLKIEIAGGKGCWRF